MDDTGTVEKMTAEKPIFKEHETQPKLFSVKCNVPHAQINIQLIQGLVYPNDLNLSKTIHHISCSCYSKILERVSLIGYGEIMTQNLTCSIEQINGQVPTKLQLINRTHRTRFDKKSQRNTPSHICKCVNMKKDFNVTEVVDH